MELEALLVARIARGGGGLSRGTRHHGARFLAEANGLAGDCPPAGTC